MEREADKGGERDTREGGGGRRRDPLFLKFIVPLHSHPPVPVPTL